MKVLLFFVALVSVTLAHVPAAPQSLLACTYTCPGSLPILSKIFTPARNPFPNPNYTPVPNGCGPKGLQINPAILPKRELEQCCNAHDVCYQTCNNVRKTCDDNFKTCMLNVCGTAMDETSRHCRSTADTFYGIVRTLGCPAFRADQSKACICK